ncbi:MAG: sugar phosphate isomerase/epimerase family protein [Opitutaceae bacterium]
MRLNQLAAQLYTVRDFCKTSADLAATAKKIRAIGYPAVQVSGIGPIPYPEVRKIFEDEDLAICATHEPGALIRSKPNEVVERLREIGCTQTAYPFPAGVDFSDPAQVSVLIEDLRRAGGVLSAEGISLSYHNHAIEFMRVEGVTILERIFSETAPHVLKAELDTYWVQYGGGDPVAWCRHLAGRLPVMHLKDYGFTAGNKPAFAEIGAGNLDFRAIIAAAEQSGCEWFIVEQDTCPGHPFDSLRSSFEYIKEHLASV